MIYMHHPRSSLYGRKTLTNLEISISNNGLTKFANKFVSSTVCNPLTNLQNPILNKGLIKFVSLKSDTCRFKGTNLPETRRFTDFLSYIKFVAQPPLPTGEGKYPPLEEILPPVGGEVSVCLFFHLPIITTSRRFLHD